MSKIIFFSLQLPCSSLSIISFLTSSDAMSINWRSFSLSKMSPILSQIKNIFKLKYYLNINFGF